MKKGFTLIELLVVVAIIGILATVVVVNLSSSQNKARNARIQTDLEQISNAAEIILTDAGEFSECSAGLANKTTAVYLNDTLIANFKEGRTGSCGTQLMTKAPVNPANNTSFFQWSSSATGGKYIIYTPSADTFTATNKVWYYCKTGKACDKTAASATAPTF